MYLAILITKKIEFMKKIKLLFPDIIHILTIMRK